MSLVKIAAAKWRKAAKEIINQFGPKSEQEHALVKLIKPSFNNNYFELQL